MTVRCRVFLGRFLWGMVQLRRRTLDLLPIGSVCQPPCRIFWIARMTSLRPI